MALKLIRINYLLVIFENKDSAKIKKLLKNF